MFHVSRDEVTANVFDLFTGANEGQGLAEESLSSGGWRSICAPEGAMHIQLFFAFEF